MGGSDSVSVGVGIGGWGGGGAVLGRCGRDRRSSARWPAPRNPRSPSRDLRGQEPASGLPSLELWGQLTTCEGRSRQAGFQLLSCGGSSRRAGARASPSRTTIDFFRSVAPEREKVLSPPPQDKPTTRIPFPAKQSHEENPLPRKTLPRAPRSPRHFQEQCGRNPNSFQYLSSSRVLGRIFQGKAQRVLGRIFFQAPSCKLQDLSSSRVQFKFSSISRRSNVQGRVPAA